MSEKVSCLLDTDVVLEVVKSVPDQRVVTFLTEQSDLWLSVIVLHELDLGLNLMSHGH